MATTIRVYRPKSRKPLSYARTAKPRKSGKKAPAASSKDRFRPSIHDAIEAVAEIRRAYDDMRVFEFRGKHDLAAFEYIVFLEGLQRVHKHLVALDLDLPEGI